MNTFTSKTARIYLDTHRAVGEISPLLFSGFAEHIGRCIYGGIYEPGSPCADERGFRSDVLAALRELNFRTIRYPGGNFLSGYHWLDGVGPKDQRPRRRELAWQSIETNQFGTNEFMEFCKLIDAKPLLGVNLGTGSIADASNLVEYCNAPAGSYYADLRVAHGYKEPHGVEYWCLGNEMDGPWQIGHLEMDEYARKARETAKMMKWQDPSIKLALCGSSGTSMPTYPEWDRVALEASWELVDYLSLHYYAGNRDDDSASYLASAAQFEDHVDTLAAVLRYVKGKLRSKHDVHLSWDEWNVWYKAQTVQGGWTEAPHLVEEVYNVEDALVVAQWLSVFLRKCDVLKIACLAQIVNVIAPILTTSDSLLRQTTFYPFMFFSRYASGLSLDVLAQSPTYPTKQYGDMPLLDVSASYDPATGDGAVFLVNRSQTEPLTTEVVWQGDAPQQIKAIYQMACNDPKAANTLVQPDVVMPRAMPGKALSGHAATVQLPPLSFTVLTC
jgi:alpha-L-arabinofuranosidase